MSITRIVAPTGVGLVGPKITDVNFIVAYKEKLSEITGGSSSDSTVLDRNIRTSTGATILREAIITPSQLVFGTFSRGIRFTSLNPEIATVAADSDGDQAIVTRVSNGTARILIQTPLLTKDIYVPVSLSGGDSGVQLLSYVTGSLAKHVSDVIDTKIAARQQQNIFSTLNHSTATYTLNNNAWPNIDVSCHQVWNSHTQGPQGVAVSPLHTIGPEHYGPPDGSTVRFIGNDGSVNTRTISSHSTIVGTDIRVRKLNSALPASVVPAKILPSTYDNYLPSIKTVVNNRSAYTIPGFFINKFCQASTAEIGMGETYSGLNFSYSLYPIEDSEPERHALYIEPIPGDSGSPLFIIINNQLVVLTTLQTPYGGPAINDYITEINSAMSSLGGGYSLTAVDLSSYTDFS